MLPADVMARPVSTGESPTETFVGRAVPRFEDERLLTGAARFVADRAEEAMLHLAFVRSPFAHARVLALDTRAAAQMPGVRAVYTAADLGAPGPLPVSVTSLAIEPAPQAVLVGVPLLGGERVRFAGEAVVAVVAGSYAEALDAVEAVEVGYEPLQPVLDLAEALGSIGAESVQMPFTPERVWRSIHATAEPQARGR